MRLKANDSKKPIELSVLVPAYNESQNIKTTLETLIDYMDQRQVGYEIIIVDDGSSDETAVLAREHVSEKIKVVRYATNMGKGFALRTAFDHSAGKIVAFFDAGLDYQPEHIMRFWQELQKQKVDIVIGSKRHPESKIEYPPKRRLLSFANRRVVKTLFNLNVTDTQVGMKIFRREVLDDIFPRALVKQFAYDIELLAMAQRYGYKIAEAPVRLNFNFSTSAVNWKTVTKTGWDTLAVFYRLRILKFYDKPAREREEIIHRMHERHLRRLKQKP